LQINAAARFWPVQLPFLGLWDYPDDDEPWNKAGRAGSPPPAERVGWQAARTERRVLPALFVNNAFFPEGEGQKGGEGGRPLPNKVLLFGY
jgi:hypothetical protein